MRHLQIIDALVIHAVVTAAVSHPIESQDLTSLNLVNNSLCDSWRLFLAGESAPVTIVVLIPEERIQ